MTDKDNETAAAAPPAQHTKMAIPAEAPAGIELDGRGNVIPFEKRTRKDQERVQEHTKTR